MDAEAIRLTTPLTDEDVSRLRMGDRVLLDGILYGARDAAHKRLVELIEKGGKLPFDLAGQVIYYVGPTPPKPGQVIGSAGPTTATRMDKYAPVLMAKGLKGTIGKGGPRSKEMREAMMVYRSIYFLTTGGASALIARHFRRSEVVAYADLGPEALFRFEVEDFPAIVVNDIYGGDLFEEGIRRYAR
ncbi:MAG: fumarate hydratase C-terminal domain-containing protein [candidate division NC10 bacterium]|nr:fumarate hydratase C-terminal domain-containing protein [candidate division NC10 bacterium]